MSSAIEVAIVTGSFTLGAVVLTYLGTGVREGQHCRREVRSAHREKIVEVAAAADDLRQRVRLYRNTWTPGGPEATGLGIRVGQLARELLPDGDSPRFSHYVMAAMLTTLSELAKDGIIGRVANTAGTMYLQAVTPAVERLTSATASLRISTDADQAVAARELASAAITYAESRSSGRKLKRAEAAFEKSLGQFMSISTKEKRSWRSRLRFWKRRR